MQGFHLAPPAFLRCLHDPRREPTHVLVGSTPVNVVPFLGLVGSGTGCPLGDGCVSTVICFASSIGWPCSLVRIDPREVSSLSRRVMSQPVSARLPAGLRFFPHLLPAPLSGGFAALLPRKGSDTGLPCSAGRTGSVEVLSLRRQRCLPMPEDCQASGPAALPVGSSLTASSACLT